MAWLPSQYESLLSGRFLSCGLDHILGAIVPTRRESCCRDSFDAA